jgi:hypothetical protein
MKTELVQSLTTHFEAHAKRTETGIEFGLHSHHFVGVNKTINS